MTQPDVILSRLLKLRRAPEDAAEDLWVRFMRPRQVGERTAHGDIDTQVRLTVEAKDLFVEDNSSGGDDVSALLGALVIARGHLRALVRTGIDVWWLEEGDLDDEMFWGFQVHV